MNSAPCKKVLAPDAFPLGSSTQRRRIPITLPRTAYPKSATDILQG